MKINKSIDDLSSISSNLKLILTSAAIKKYKLMSLLLTLAVFVTVPYKAIAASDAAIAFDQELRGSITELPASEFKNQIETLSDGAQEKAMKTFQNLGFPAADTASMRVSSDGSIFYVEPAVNRDDESGKDMPYPTSGGIAYLGVWG